jgi:hypothetical protein
MKARASADIESQAQKLRQEHIEVAAERAEIAGRLSLADSEAAQQQEEITRLRERMEMQFRSSKQELEAAIAEQRRLRQQLAKQGATASGAALPSALDAPGGMLPPPVDSPSSGAPGTAGEDVSAWASQLLSNLSQDGIITGAPCASVGSATVVCVGGDVDRASVMRDAA